MGATETKPEVERTPLGSVFIGTGEFIVRRRRQPGEYPGDVPEFYGPFLNWAVAMEWGKDAFGRDNFAVGKLAEPWRVPPEERKS